MSASACESDQSVSTANADTFSPNLLDTLVETADNKLKKHKQGHAVSEGETEGEVGERDFTNPGSNPALEVGESRQEYSILQSSSDSFSDGSQQLQVDSSINKTIAPVDGAATNTPAGVVETDTASSQSSRKGDTHSNQSSAKSKSWKEAAKEERKDDKKKSKKKEDKSVEYILRALNSLHSPQEKLAALCKKYADLHEEHRVLQNSFKSQQRNLTLVAKEKDQIQSEHTKAMIAKSKLESLCRELQKHNKIIKDESIKRGKEDDEKRKEISAQFNATIGEIQNQMSDNSEKNNSLRKENDNLAEQLRAFISQCHGREEHVKKLQEHHDLEKKLAAAKLAQAEAILKEVEERSSKEKELMLLKLTEITKKSHITESQLDLYKTKYDEFNDLHSRSSETFQKYKTEMDKMAKRVKKLEKDGLQWKAKWESTNKTLIEQYDARSKTEQEITVYAKKVKKLESLCRALQAELHGKKVAQEKTDDGEAENSTNLQKDDSPASVVDSGNCSMGSSSERCGHEQPSSDPGLNSSPKSLASLSSTTPSDPNSVLSEVVTDTVDCLSYSTSPEVATNAVDCHGDSMTDGLSNNQISPNDSSNAQADVSRRIDLASLLTQSSVLETLPDGSQSVVSESLPEGAQSIVSEFVPEGTQSMVSESEPESAQSVVSESGPESAHSDVSASLPEGEIMKQEVSALSGVTV